MLQVPDLYDQKSLRMIFDSLFKAQQQADEQREGQQRELAQLKREGQTVTSQLESYNLLKKQVLEFKDSIGEFASEELRLGLLFQYLQEIKMRIVAQRVLQNYKDGKEMRMQEFININGSNKPDGIARELLQTNPNLVLQVLQTEELASQGL